MGKNEQGFTLVELMVGIAILVLIMSATYGILASSIKSYQYNFSQGQNIQDSRQLFNEITKGIKNATAITKTTPTLEYSIADTITGVTDKYVISLNSTTSSVELKKNTDMTRSFGAGRVDKILFTSGSGAKKEITIELYFKSNPSQPIKTTVMTLNDIP